MKVDKNSRELLLAAELSTRSLALVLAQMSIYEHTRDVSREAEQLRLSLSTSRQALSRLEEEAAQSRAESSRTAAALVEKDKEAHHLVDTYQTRLSKLSMELEQVRLA
jgi:hypothetical protein